MLTEVLSRALLHFKVRSSLTIEGDQFLAHPSKPGFVPGTERPFEAPNAVLGLAVILETKQDTLGHWVAMVGNDHLNIALKPKGGWNGIVLDLQRGYELFKVNEKIKDGKRPVRLTLSTFRYGERKEIAVYQVYSFVSVSVK